MKKVKKQALFTTIVTFSKTGMVFSPDNADVTEMLLNMLDDMILTIKNIARIYKRLEKYVNLKKIEDVKIDL